MKKQSIFFINSSHKTKTWWMFLSVLIFVFVPFLIVWLLCGEFNLLNLDWIIAKNASVWHGEVTQNNYEWLAQRYHAYFSSNGIDALKSELFNNWLNKTASINAYRTFFNPIVLAPIFGLFIWCFIYPIVFNAFKISGLDMLPFSFGVGSFMMGLIILGLVDQWGQNMLPLYWIVKILIAIVFAAIFFIITNYFVNKHIANSIYATDYYFGYKIIDKQNALAKQELKENIDIFKKQKDDEESYVEIKDGE